MANRNLTGRTQYVAIRCPLDVFHEAQDRADDADISVSRAIVQALRFAWDLPEVAKDKQ